jgi:hypothetical protein
MNVDGATHNKNHFPVDRVRQPMNVCGSSSSSSGCDALTLPKPQNTEHNTSVDVSVDVDVVGVAGSAGGYFDKKLFQTADFYDIELFPTGYIYDEMYDNEVFHSDWPSASSAPCLPCFATPSLNNTQHRLGCFAKLQAITEMMSPGAIGTHISSITADGHLEFSRDATRDLNFIWQLGLELALANGIINYKGIALGNRKQHFSTQKHTLWQHCYFWEHAQPLNYQQRRLQGKWPIDAFKINSNSNTNTIIMYECEHEMPLETPIQDAIKSLQKQIRNPEIIECPPEPKAQQQQAVQQSPSKTVRFEQGTNTEQTSSSSSSNSTKDSFQHNMHKYMQ